MKEKITKIFIALMLIVIVSYFGYQFLKKDTSEEAGEPVQTKSEKEVAIEELADKYDALTNWNENIHYTIQLQDLISKSDRPILFTGYIDDIFKKDEQYFIRFVTDFLTTPEIRFVLQSDYDKILGVLDASEGDDLLFKFFGDYAVVASIDEIKKMNLQITGYLEGAEEVALEYTPADIYIATGNCIDFIYIGDIFETD